MNPVQQNPMQSLIRMLQPVAARVGNAIGGVQQQMPQGPQGYLDNSVTRLITHPQQSMQQIGQLNNTQAPFFGAARQFNQNLFGTQPYANPQLSPQQRSDDFVKRIASGFMLDTGMPSGTDMVNANQLKSFAQNAQQYKTGNDYAMSLINNENKNPDLNLMSNNAKVSQNQLGILQQKLNDAGFKGSIQDFYNQASQGTGDIINPGQDIQPATTRGSMPPTPDNTAGLYGGQNAQNMPQEGQFSSMADKSTQFEINDQNAALNLKNSKSLLEGKIDSTTLGNILNHPDLYKQYPQLKDVNVQVVSWDNSSAVSGYDPSTNTIVLNQNMLSVKNDPETLPSLLHEVQHAIQAQEGFTAGTSPVKMANSLLGGNPDLGNVVNNVQARAKDLYSRNLGEVQARDAAWRMMLNPQQRMMIQPLAGQNIPLNQILGAIFK
jgi:hypothetical protein